MKPLKRVNEETSMVMLTHGKDNWLQCGTQFGWEIEWVCEIHFRGYFWHSGKKSRHLFMWVFPDQYQTWQRVYPQLLCTLMVSFFPSYLTQFKMYNLYAIVFFVMPALHQTCLWVAGIASVLFTSFNSST